MFTFIGRGSAFNTSLGNTSAYFKNGHCMLLIDCGSSVFAKILELNLLDNVDQLHIVITHTHPDHVGSLGDLILYAYYIKNLRATIYFPDEINLRNILNLMGIKSEFFKLISTYSNQILFSEESFTMRFFPAKHVDNLLCFGVLFHFFHHTIFYSGDSSEIHSEILRMLKEGTIHIFYQDVCGLDYSENPHMYFGKLITLIPQNLRGKVYCMHTDKSLDEEIMLGQGFHVVKL